jgi:uncharacterized protein (DUF4415 family)
MSRKNISDTQATDEELARQAAFEGEVPELDSDWFRRAAIRSGDRVIRPATGTLTRRGRPPLGASAKVQQSLRLSREVLDHFRATGSGWQARLDEVLLRHVREAQDETRRVAEERGEYRGE